MTLTIPDGPLHVVCLGAHPDDIEIGCGATLLRFGSERTLTADLFLATGTSQRRAEARAAADAFVPGARLEFAEGFTDGYLPEMWGDVKRAVHRLAERVPSPDIVLCPRPDDAHQDHRLLGRIAPTEWRSSLVLHYEIPKWDGDVGRPQVYVPIPDEVALAKVSKLNAVYPSQVDRDWWDDEMFLGFMRMRGMECRSRYAEAFTTSKMVVGL